MARPKKDGPRIRDQGILRTRLADEIMRQLEESAVANHRSVSAEVAYRLQQSFEAPALIEAIEATVRQTMAMHWRN